MPSVKELEVATLQVFTNGQETFSNDFLLNQVAAVLNLPKEILEIKHSGNRSEVEYRLAWARTNLRKQNKIERVGPGLWKRLN